MAKNKEKDIAYHFYTAQHMTAKAIAMMVGVNEKTVGDWIKKGGWQQIRNAGMNTPEVRTENIKELINNFNEEQLEIARAIKTAKIDGDKKQIKELRKQSAAISQEVAIQSKLLEKMSKEDKIPLTTYIAVMRDVFEYMEKDDPFLHVKTMDFQQEHLQRISIKLG